jgi:ParB family chromosome partitioning protein
MGTKLNPSDLQKAEKRLLAKGCKRKTGDLWEVPISVLKIDQKYCFRKSRNSTLLKAMAGDIEKKGILNLPVAIYSLETDELVLAVGFGRVACLNMNKKEYAPCRILINQRIESEEIFELILTDNLHREDMKPVELAIFYRTWMRETGMNQKEMAEEINKSETYISELIGPLSKLSDEEIEMILTSDLKRSQVMELAKIEDKGKRIELMERGASVREIREITGKQKNMAKETDPNVFCLSDKAAKCSMGDAEIQLAIKFPDQRWRNEDVIELLAGIIEKLSESSKENNQFSIEKLNF